MEGGPPPRGASSGTTQPQGTSGLPHCSENICVTFTHSAREWEEEAAVRFTAPYLCAARDNVHTVSVLRLHRHISKHLSVSGFSLCSHLLQSDVRTSRLFQRSCDKCWFGLMTNHCLGWQERSFSLIYSAPSLVFSPHKSLQKVNDDTSVIHPFLLHSVGKLNRVQACFWCLCAVLNSHAGEQEWGETSCELSCCENS